MTKKPLDESNWRGQSRSSARAGAAMGRDATTASTARRRATLGRMNDLGDGIGSSRKGSERGSLSASLISPRRYTPCVAELWRGCGEFWWLSEPLLRPGAPGNVLN